MPEYYDSFDEVDHHPTYHHDPYDRVTTVYNEDYHDEEFTPVVDVTKAYLEPPPPTMPPTTSYSAMYYDTPGHNDVGNDNYDTPMDKIDDHIEVFELTFPPNETSSIEVEMVPYDNDILKDYYIGDSTRRPNSYFYNEGEMKESSTINHLLKETTPTPNHKDPLPTYKTYTDHYPSTTEVPVSSSSTTPTTTESTTYFPSTEPTRRQQTFTTFQPYFQQGSKQVTPTSSTVRLGTTPSIRFSTTTYDPHSFAKNTMEKKVDKMTEPKVVSKVYQQFGAQPAINITSPSEKSWERVVTLKPELDRRQDVAMVTTPMSISTTQNPAPELPDNVPIIDMTSTTKTPSIFVTSPSSWGADDAMMKHKKKKTEFTIVTTQAPDVTENIVTTTRRKYPTRSTMKPGFFDTTSKTKFSYNTGIKWGTPNKDEDPIKLSIRRNFNDKGHGKRRRNPFKNKLRRKTTLKPFENIIDKDAGNEILDDIQDNINKSPYKPKMPALQFTTTRSPITVSSTKPAKFDMSKTLNKIIERSSAMTTSRPRQFVTNNVWTATKQPPPEAITTPGWHFHKNAEVRKKMHRSNDVTKHEDIPEETAMSRTVEKKVLLEKEPETTTKKFVNRRLKPQFPRKDLMKPKHHIQRKMFEGPKQPKMLKFTAEDAIPNDVDDDGAGADSSSFMSITPFRQRLRSKQRQLSRHREIVLPEKAARRMDLEPVQGQSSSSPSYKITPNLKSGGYKISPVVKSPPRQMKSKKPMMRRIDSPSAKPIRPSSRRFRQHPNQKPAKKDGSWLLVSPHGREFQFRSLQQIYDLNQNNFVPGWSSSQTKSMHV